MKVNSPIKAPTKLSDGVRKKRVEEIANLQNKLKVVKKMLPGWKKDFLVKKYSDLIKHFQVSTGLKKDDFLSNLTIEYMRTEVFS